MVKSVADYQVMFDGGFTLDAATPVREKDLTFILPDNFKIENGIRKPILAFHAWAQEDSNFKVRINAREVLSWTLSAGITRGMWDPFNGSVPFPEGANIPANVPVKFSIQQGKVTFGQVVIWYQVDVASP
jgi:hypothetical protein